MIRTERDILKNAKRRSRVASVPRTLACAVVGLSLAVFCLGSDTAFGDPRDDFERHKLSKAIENATLPEYIYGGKVQIPPEDMYRPVMTLESQNGLQLTISRSDRDNAESAESQWKDSNGSSLEIVEGEDALHAEGACEACDALRELYRQGAVSNLYSFLLPPENVLPNDRFDFHLPIPDEQRVAALQCQDGALTECNALHKGKLSVSSGFLSPFGIVDGDHFSTVAACGIDVKGARRIESDEEASQGVHIAHYTYDNEGYSADDDKATNGVQNSLEQVSNDHMNDDSKTSEDSFDSGLATIRTIIIIAGIGALIVFAGFAWEKFKYSRFLKACGLDKELGQKK